MNEHFAQVGQFVRIPWNGGSRIAKVVRVKSTGTLVIRAWDAANKRLTKEREMRYYHVMTSPDHYVVDTNVIVPSAHPYAMAIEAYLRNEA